MTNKKKNENLVAQSRRLVEARYNFSVWETRVYLKMIEMIRSDDDGFKTYKIYLDDLIKEHGGNSKNVWQILQEVPDKLLNKKVSFKYSEEINGKVHNFDFKANLIASAKYLTNWKELGESPYLELTFAPELKPYLLSLKRDYLLYDRRNILHLQSKFSVRIYQLLKDKKRKGERITVFEILVQELRNMLLVDNNGNPTNQYSKYYLFKKRVLFQAQKELQEHTDIAFSFDELKRGRKVLTIRFYIRDNRKKKKTTEQTQTIKTKQAPKERPTAKAPDLNDPIYQTVAFQRLIDKGVTHNQAFKLVTDNEEGFILDTLDFCDQAQKEGTVKNLAAFVVSSIRNKSFIKEIEEAKRKKEAKQRAIEERRIKEQNHRQIQKLNDQFEELKQKKIEEIKANLTKEEEKEIVRMAKEGSPFVAKKTYEDVKNSIFFDFVLVSRFAGTERLPKKDSNFLEWMKVNHKKEVIRNSETDKYELVS